MRIVLLSNHWYPSPRRAAFHHLADAWHAQGHEIAFVTVGLSAISWLRRDKRTAFAGIRAACNCWQDIDEGFASYVYCTLWHPHTTMCQGLEALLAPVMRRYGRHLPPELAACIRKADLVMYESCAALYLFTTCRQLAPQARHLYKVSDDIRSLPSAPADMLALEQEIAPLFSMLSVPCRVLQEKFRGLSNVRLHKHGLDKAAYDACHENPYAPETQNAVFSGVGFYDAAAVHSMARGCPGVHFHILGITRPQGDVPHNVRYYGELPFATTIPYVKYASVGLYTMKETGRPMQAYTDSLKVMQYRYCGLPIIAPDFLDLHREGVFYYTLSAPASCAAALEAALAHGRHPDYANEVLSWDEVARQILEDL